MPVSGLFSRWSASRRRALVLSSAGYLVGMGEVPLLFFVCFQFTGSELNPVHITFPPKFLYHLFFISIYTATLHKIRIIGISKLMYCGLLDAVTPDSKTHSQVCPGGNNDHPDLPNIESELVGHPSEIL